MCDRSGQNKVHLVVLSVPVCATLTVQVVFEYLMRFQVVNVLRSRRLISFCFCRALVEKCDFEKVFEPRVDFSVQPAESSAFFGVCSTV